MVSSAMQTRATAPCVSSVAPRVASVRSAGGMRAAGAVRRAPVAPRAGGLSYKSAGVDIDAGNELVRRIQKINPSIGGFSGMVPLGDQMLVAGTDGVGTKLKLAFDMNMHDTVGIDLVAMSVNDIITCGAKPLFFLDYYATGKLDVDAAEQVVKGIVAGCQESDCVLLGGETAEMPGFYTPGEYDLAGFAVGVVHKDKVIDGSKIRAGDVILGIPSSGVHSNGFSLVRAALKRAELDLHAPAPWLQQDASAPDAVSAGASLLTPTALYPRAVAALTAAAPIKGLVHVTGGGLPENVPRVVPKGLQARFDSKAWTVPGMFKWVQEAGDVSREDMFRTFNMGVGLVIVVAKEDADKVLAAGVGASVIGDIVQGTGVEIL